MNNEFQTPEENCCCIGKCDCEECSCKCECGKEEEEEVKETNKFESQFGPEKRYLFGPSHTIPSSLKTISMKIPRKDPK